MVATVPEREVLARPPAARPTSPEIRPRRRLPGSRAVVGGLLVALAALGVLAAYTGVTAGPSTTYVVAARDLAPGERLEVSDLRTIEIDLPAEMTTRVFSDPSSLTGATVLAPIAAGELLQLGALARQGGATGTREMSFPVEADLALGGSLQPGERIDVIATYGTGTDATTAAVVVDVPVVTIADAGAALGGRFVVITVALSSDTDVVALGHAARAGQLVVIRSTGARPWSEPPPHGTPDEGTGSGG